MISSIFSDTYWQGTVLDAWIIPHALFGVVMYLVVRNVHMGNWLGLFATLLMAIAWEILEISVGVFETTANHILDVGISIIMYVILWVYIFGSNKDEESLKMWFVRFSILFILVSIVGWMREYFHHFVL